jgi:hypothetical protein
MMPNARSFHYTIGCMAGLDYPVNSERKAGEGTEPNLVVSLSLPQQVTAVLPQFLPNLLLILRHQATTA